MEDNIQGAAASRKKKKQLFSRALLFPNTRKEGYMKGHGAAKMASFVKKVLTLLLSVLQLEPIYPFALTAQNEMRKKKKEREEDLRNKRYMC